MRRLLADQTDRRKPSFTTRRFANRHIARICVSLACFGLLGWVYSNSAEGQTNLSRDNGPVTKAYHEGLVASKKGDFLKARHCFAEALKESTAANPKSRRSMLCLYQLGENERKLGEYQHAAEALTKALAMQEQLLAPDHTDTLRTIEALLRINQSAGAIILDYATIENLRARKKQILVDLFGKEKNAQTSNAAPAIDNVDRLRPHSVVADVDESKKSRAHEGSQTDAEKDQLSSHLPSQAELLVEQGDAELSENHCSSALQLYRKAQPLLEKTDGKNNVQLVPFLQSKIRTEIRSNDYKNAIADIDHLVVLEKSKHRSTEDAVDLLRAGAFHLFQRHDLTTYKSWYDKAIILSDTPTQRAKHLAITLEYVWQLQSANQFADAEKTLNAAISAKPSPNVDERFSLLGSMYALRTAQKRYADAADLVRKMQLLARHKEKPSADDNATLSWQLGHCLLSEGRLKDAVPYFAEAASKVESRNLAKCYRVELGQVLLCVGEGARAQKALDSALSTCSDIMNDSELSTAYEDMSQAMNQQGKKEEAARFKKMSEIKAAAAKETAAGK